LFVLNYETASRGAVSILLGCDAASLGNGFPVFQNHAFSIPQELNTQWHGIISQLHCCENLAVTNYAGYSIGITRNWEQKHQTVVFPLHYLYRWQMGFQMCVPAWHKSGSLMDQSSTIVGCNTM